MDESEAPKYFCHQCNQGVNPITESEIDKCSICRSGFVEQMTSALTTPDSETPFSFISRLPDYFQPPFSQFTSELFRFMSPLPLASPIRRGPRRLNWDDDEDGDDDERNFDYFMEPDFDLLLLNDPTMYGVNPAQKEAVEALPTVKVKETISCCVCLDECEIGCEVTEMPCKHTFHGECILPWLELHNSCPLCRHELPSAVSEIDKLEFLNNNSTQEDRSDSRIIGADFVTSPWGDSRIIGADLVIRSWGLSSLTFSSPILEDRTTWSSYNSPLVNNDSRRDSSWIYFTSQLPDSPFFTGYLSTTSPVINSIGEGGLNHIDIGGEDKNDNETFSRFFMDIHPPSKRLTNALWSMNGRHLPSEAYGTFSSLFGALIYELGDSYKDKSIPRDANFCSHADPSVAIQPFGCADVIGGPIDDPKSCSSPFKDDKYLVAEEAKSVQILSSPPFS